MNRIIWGIAVFTCLLSLSSCSTVRKSASTITVQTSLSSSNKADLAVSSTKIRLENYVPTREEHRGGKENVKNAAIARLLRENGDADVLIEPQFEIVTRHRLFTRRLVIKRISVSGYPATYTNFSNQ